MNKVTDPKLLARNRYTCPQIDLSGCVFYAPLWRPELSGSSFTSVYPSSIDCTVTGAVWTPGGRKFDGSDDSINCGDDSTLKPTSYITVVAWVKMSTYPTTPTSAFIVAAQDTGSNRGYLMAINVNGDGDMRGSFYKSSNGTGWDDFNSSSYGTIVPNIFHQIVGTYDGTTSYLYLDGTLIDTGNNSGTGIHQCTGDVYLGINPDGDVYCLDGYLGEVMIFNRALSLSEIRRNYEATKRRYK